MLRTDSYQGHVKSNPPNFLTIMYFNRLRGSSKSLNRKCPIILLLTLRVNLSGFHFILITFCDCPSQVFEFRSISKCSLPYVISCLFWCLPNIAKIFVMPICRPSLRPSARVECLGSQWTDFHENQYLRIF
jgi:hypothetical protein